MPLPKDMEACMHKVKKEYPHGRSKKEMSAKKAHKQHVAMCLNTENYQKPSIKKLIEGMTFKGYLVASSVLSESEVLDYIRSHPLYQEMRQDPDPAVQRKAATVAGNLNKQLAGMSAADAESYIEDALSDLHASLGGTTIGDWEGERAYQKRKEAEDFLGKMGDEWERAMGTSAETGEELPKSRKKAGAQQFTGDTDADARAEVDAMYANPDKYSRFADPRSAQPTGAYRGEFSQAEPDEQAERLAAARTQAKVQAPPGGEDLGKGSKKAAGRVIFDEMFGQARTGEIIQRIMNEVGLSKPHATTYFYTYKKEKESGGAAPRPSAPSAAPSQTSERPRGAPMPPWGETNRPAAPSAAPSKPTAAAPRSGGESKASVAQRIFDEMYGNTSPLEIKKRLQSEAGLTSAGASTYYYKMKGKADGR